MRKKTAFFSGTLNFFGPSYLSGFRQLVVQENYFEVEIIFLCEIDCSYWEKYWSEDKKGQSLGSINLCLLDFNTCYHFDSNF